MVGLDIDHNNNYNRTGDLCTSCSSKGKLNGIYNQKHSNEIIEKMSESHTGIKRKPFTNEHKKNLSKNHHDVSGKLNPAWIGGYVKDRSHLLSENQCLKINKRFENSEAHHIASDVIVYIPKELHKHIKHILKTNKNMNIINLLSLQYLKGNL